MELERGPLKGDCHNIHAGILKDLGRLDEAEKVSMEIDCHLYLWPSRACMCEILFVYFDVHMRAA